MRNRCKQNPCCGDQTYCTQLDLDPEVVSLHMEEDEADELWNAHVDARKALYDAITAQNTVPERYYNQAADHLAECEARFVETYTALRDREEMTESDEEPVDL